MIDGIDLLNGKVEVIIDGEVQVRNIDYIERDEDIPQPLLYGVMPVLRDNEKVVRTVYGKILIFKTWS
jgi:hypothetical protein